MGLTQQSDQSAFQWQERRKLLQRPVRFLDERNDNANSGRDVHQNFVGSDNRVNCLSKFENQERQKARTAQRIDKVIMQVEHATKRELTNTSNLNGKLSLNKQLRDVPVNQFPRDRDTRGLLPEVVADVDDDDSALRSVCGPASN